VKARRPLLLVLVFGVFLVLVGVTASALVAITSDHLTRTTLNASVERDASLVELFVNDNLRTADLPPAEASAARTRDLGSRLRAMTRDDAILRVEIHSVDGKVLFASDPSAVGRRPPLVEAMRLAVSRQQPSAELDEGGDGQATDGSPASGRLLREYLPVVDEDGRTRAVVAIFRDADRLLAGISRVQRDVVVVIVGAAAVLAAILFLIFRAAHVRIGRQQRALVEATRRDPLTGMLNHGALVAELTEAVEAVRHHGRPLAIALVDVDNFTLLNDTHGHQAGDQVLRQVAAIVDGIGGVTAGRYGPDEFLVLWSGTAPEGTDPAIEEARRRLAQLSVRFGQSERLPVTASIGLAGVPEHASSVSELLSAATVALQEAKSGGGDAVRHARRAEERTVSGSFDVLQGLVIAVDTKDRYTKRHSEDVARYAVFLGRRLGLDEEVIATLRVSGLLHDVGKIGIPDTLLRKPGRLSAQEFEIFKQHVALGDAIVRDLPNLDSVRQGIRHHHERWDGHGYLEGLEGDQIPLIARILAVADTFSAMTTTRPYRKALGLREALKRLGDAAGTQLEENLVVAFIAGIETAPDAPLPGEESTAIWLPQARVA
jgi:diguanylate cyclase (GGDEF)-like protein